MKWQIYSALFSHFESRSLQVKFSGTTTGWHRRLSLNQKVQDLQQWSCQGQSKQSRFQSECHWMLSGNQRTGFCRSLWSRWVMAHSNVVDVASSRKHWMVFLNNAVTSSVHIWSLMLFKDYALICFYASSRTSGIYCVSASIDVSIVKDKRVSNFCRYFYYCNLCSKHIFLQIYFILSWFSFNKIMQGNSFFSVTTKVSFSGEFFFFFFWVWSVDHRACEREQPQLPQSTLEASFQVCSLLFLKCSSGTTPPPNTCILLHSSLSWLQ